MNKERFANYLPSSAQSIQIGEQTQFIKRLKAGNADGMSCASLFFPFSLYHISHRSENKVSIVRAYTSSTHINIYTRDKNSFSYVRKLAISLKASKHNSQTSPSHPCHLILRHPSPSFTPSFFRANETTRTIMQKHAHNEWQYTIINTLHT